MWWWWYSSCKYRNGYKGVDAVIDKDRTSARLAIDLKADVLLILTAVDQVAINYKEEDEQKLRTMTVKEAKEFIEAKEFAEGSMLPKVEACIDFAEKSKGYAMITSLKKAKLALEGKTGTVIRKK